MKVSEISVGTRFISIAGEYRVTSITHGQGGADVELSPVSGGSTVSTAVVSTTYGKWIR